MFHRIYSAPRGAGYKIGARSSRHREAVRPPIEVFMFVMSLQRDECVRRYSICAAGSLGWEVRLEEDHVVRRLDHYHDWHRVERALASFEREVVDLTSRGWQVAGPRPQSVNR